MKEYVPPLEIAAESCMNNSGETVLTLYGDHGVPDVIVCDGKRYTQEPTVDRDALLALARDLEVSIMESGVCGDVAGLVLNIVKQIREACGEVK